MSALLSPSPGPSNTVTAFCATCEGTQPHIRLNADSILLSATLPLTLTILTDILSWPFYVQHGGRDSHRQKGIKKLSGSQNEPVVHITPSLSGVATTLT